MNNTGLAIIGGLISRIGELRVDLPREDREAVLRLIRNPQDAADISMIALAKIAAMDLGPVPWNRDHMLIGGLSPEQRVMFGAKADWLSMEARNSGDGWLEQAYLRLAVLTERAGMGGPGFTSEDAG